MCAAAARSTWPKNDMGLPILNRDSGDLGSDPTVRAELSFGQVTLPVVRSTPVPPAPHAGGFVKAHPRRPSPTPKPNVMDAMPAPLVAPPPSPTKALVIGFTIGTSVGLAILGACWHFFL